MSKLPSKLQHVVAKAEVVEGSPPFVRRPYTAPELVASSSISTVTEKTFGTFDHFNFFGTLQFGPS